MRFRNWTLITGASLAGFAFLTTGCGGSSGGGGGQKDPQIMFVNACADGSVKFFYNDEDKSGTLAYKQSTKGFLTVPFEEKDPQFEEVSVEEPNRSTVYDTQDQTFLRDSSTIVVGIGTKNPSDTELVKRLKMIFLSPDRRVPNASQSRLIFLHAFNRKSPFSTPILVLKTVGDTPIFQSPDTPYGRNNAIDIDSGTYKFYGNGDSRNNYLEAKDPNNDQVYAENKNPSRPAIFKPGKVYLVMAAGVEAADSRPGELVIVEVPTEE